MSADEIRCFVIMPFSKTSPKHTEAYWTRHWKFLKNKIEECSGVKAHRSKALRGDIVRSIITDLYQADIVVADLTDKNPNVYWELGVRQSFKHGTVTIAEYRHKIASDMGMKSVLRYYPRNSMKNEEFISELKEAINDCIKNPEESDSNVLEVISGRGSIYEIINEQENKRKIEGLLAELSYNKNAIEKIYEYIKKNTDIRKETKKEPGKREELEETIAFSSDSLRNSSIENLLVNRYLEIELDIYGACEKVCSRINTINTLVVQWAQSDEWVENWFMKYRKGTTEILEIFEEVMNKIYEKYE